MDTVQIEFEPFIDEAARQFIVNGLDMHNIAATALPDYCPVNFVLRGGRGDVLGGVLGLLWGGWLQVTYARSRGALGATLETYSFQARPFYERLGYEVFSALEGHPPGHVKFFLRKAFA